MDSKIRNLGGNDGSFRPVGLNFEGRMYFLVDVRNRFSPKTRQQYQEVEDFLKRCITLNSQEDQNLLPEEIIFLRTEIQKLTDDKHEGAYTEVSLTKDGNALLGSINAKYLSNRES